MYRAARKNKGLTVEAAAELINISPRSLYSYEKGEQVPPPNVVMKMAEVYSEPLLKACYCKSCPLGREHYQILDNIDSRPVSVLVKLEEEMDEAKDVLKGLFKLMINKDEYEDFSKEELENLSESYQELLDLEHAIEILKFSMETKGWVDNRKEIEKHNQKCIDRKFCTKEKSH